MPEFRSRPTTVFAVQFTGTPDPPGVLRDPAGRPYVVTVHGQSCYIEPGDYVVTEPDGVHHYPCKPDIFLARWEPV